MKTNDLIFDRSFVNGEWTIQGDSTFEVTNPANGDCIQTVSDGGIEITEMAINAADKAFKSWQKTTAKYRAGILERWNDLILEQTEKLAEIMTLECGKPLQESKGEVAYGAAFIKWFAEEGKRTYGDVIPPHTEDRRLVVIKQPVGVVAAITPWNFPLAMITRKVAPALAAGCTVVIKPSYESPLTALAVVYLAKLAGFPPGVINVIGGWFFTALSAFVVCGIIVYLIHFGGFTSILIILSIILLIIGRNFISHRRDSQKQEAPAKVLISESESFEGVIKESARNIANVIGKTYQIYSTIIRGLSHYDLKTLYIAKKDVDQLYDEVNDLRNGVFYFLKGSKETSVSSGRFYISLLGVIYDLVEDLSYLSNVSYKHVNNNHSGLKKTQIQDLNEIYESLSSLFKEGIEAFSLEFSEKEFQDVLVQKSENFELLNSKIDAQILRTQSETSPKTTALYFNILIRTKDLILHKYSLIEEFFQVTKDVKSKK